MSALTFQVRPVVDDLGSISFNLVPLVDGAQVSAAGLLRVLSAEVAK